MQWAPDSVGNRHKVLGSTTISDWLPSNRSAILVSEFSHPRELASFIRRLDYDDGLYGTYVEWKLKGEISNQRLLTALQEREWGVQDINQDNYIDTFECMVCRRVWANRRLQEQVSGWKSGGGCGLSLGVVLVFLLWLLPATGLHS